MFSRVKLMMAAALGRMLGSTPLSLHRAALDHNRTVGVLREIERTRAIAHRMAHGAARLLPRRRAKGNGYKGPNGVQAMARRVRQIASGHLTLSNGLRTVAHTSRTFGTCYWAARHGKPIIVTANDRFIVGPAM